MTIPCGLQSCELYDRLSALYQEFPESLTSTYKVPNAASTPCAYIEVGACGSPENTDMLCTQSQVCLPTFQTRTRLNKLILQPMIRTHPTTDWKALFAGGRHCRRIDGVSDRERQEILTKILRTVAESHDLQGRFK